MEFIYLATAFIIGAAIGSFIHVIVLRYNTGLSFIQGNSVCLSCSVPLSWYHLIPIFSYLALKGRCSHCYSHFSIQYFLAELISGITFVWLFLFSNFSLFQSFLLSLIFFILLFIFIYDLRHKIIPDPSVYLFIVISFLYAYITNLCLPDPVIQAGIFPFFLAAFIIPFPFFLIWFFSKGRMMGLGDVKFMVGMGALLGLSSGVSAIFLSFWIGATYVLLAFVYKKLFKKGYNMGMKTELPFAPFLIIATLLVFIFKINLVNF
ncbi:MAG TPA: prepilin peptidase [Candidatus Paceibacterota bacterium]